MKRVLRPLSYPRASLCLCIQSPSLEGLRVSLLPLMQCVFGDGVSGGKGEVRGAAGR